MRALISVSDKTGIIDVAKKLQKLGVEILSTGGTARVLRDAGITVRDVSDLTHFPEMLDGRVKTLHPMVHGGLLAVRSNPEHMATVKKHEIELIDLVIINLYPFEATIKKENVTLEDAIENIDIGGPGMIRSAAKNHQDVAVIVNPAHYAGVLAELATGTISLQTKQKLAVEAFEHTARYDTLISDYLRKKYQSSITAFPDTYWIPMTKCQSLRYGENPHQHAAFYGNPIAAGLANATQLQGKELSFNNILDLDAAYGIAREWTQPAAIIIKHTNPCGVALGKTLDEAYQKAFDADPVSAYGGIVGLNQPVDVATANLLVTTFLEAIIAPAFSQEALKILRTKKNLRLIALENFFAPFIDYDIKKVRGGFLLQDLDKESDSENLITIPTIKKPTTTNLADLNFAFIVVKHVKSNAIVIAKNGVILGVGAGQTSRIDSVGIAIKKAGRKTKGAVMASDAFFPFRDSVDRAAKAGIQAIIQPGGSVKDQESIDAANEHHIAMIMTSQRHFKH